MANEASLRDLDKRHLIHPFTNHADLHAMGTHLITAAEGCWVTDDKGHRLLDGLAGLWCVNVGHGRKEITDAVTRQMKQVAYYPSFFNTTTEPTIRLAERLARLAPARLKRVVFSNSGSEANETALKIIRNYHKLKGQPQRTKILTREFAYHGVTLATTSMTGLPRNGPMIGTSIRANQRWIWFCSRIVIIENTPPRKMSKAQGMPVENSAGLRIPVIDIMGTASRPGV